MLKHLLLLFVTVCAVSAQFPSLGACPQIAAKTGFNWASFAGKWYEFSKIPNFYEGLDKCITNTYSGTAPNMQMGLSRANMTTGVFKVYNATLTTSTTDGSFKAVFHDVPFGIPLNVKVIDTDYSSYAVLYSCWDLFGIVRLEFAWIKTKARFPIPFPEAANVAYDKTKLNRNLLIPTDQFNCPFLH